METEAKLLLLAAIVLFTLTPLWKRMFPGKIRITRDEIRGWQISWEPD